MVYYGIVDKIKDEHKSGVYGRRKLTDEEKKLFGKLDYSDLAIVALSTLINPLPILLLRKKPGEIELQFPAVNNENQLIFIDNLLMNDYTFGKQSDLFYGLFDHCISKENALKSVLRSGGGSKLIITDRKGLQGKKHFGGELGKFHSGLYCNHPKDVNILIPLDKSSRLVESFILEETIKAFEALGAKKIIIEDVTQLIGKLKGKRKDMNYTSSGNYSKKILKEKHFGKGTFDPDRALENSLFIHDFPHIMTTIEGRIKGNQTYEKFNEHVNLSAGLDIEVVNMFSLESDFEYDRKWKFEIEFYDKNG